MKYFIYRSVISLFVMSVCLSRVFPLDFGPTSKSKVRRTVVVPVSQAVWKCRIASDPRAFISYGTISSK